MLLWKEEILFENKGRVTDFITVQDKKNMSKTNRNRLKSSLSHVSVNPLRTTYRCQLFRVPRCPLVRFPVCFIDPGVHTVHALCPLPVDHSSLFLTNSQTEKNQGNSIRRRSITADSIAADVLVPSVLDITLHSVKFFTEHATRFEG